MSKISPSQQAGYNDKSAATPLSSLQGSRWQLVAASVLLAAWIAFLLMMAVRS
jgi:hypothetical protein